MRSSSGLMETDTVYLFFLDADTKDLFALSTREC